MRRSFVAIGLFSLLLGACAGSNPGNNNVDGYNSDCDASNESGIYLTALGTYDFDMIAGGSIALRAMTVHLDDGSHETAGVAAGVTVHFEIISISGDGALSVASAETDTNGIAEVEFTATEEGPYQVVAVADGTCDVTFSVAVADQLRGLRVVSANPVNAFTNSRINLSVQAYSPDPGFGEYPLVGEEITFNLSPGGAGSALEQIGGGLSGAQITATTSPLGIATIAMLTGTAGVPAGLDVTATLQGTAPVSIHINIADQGTGPCQSNADCPAAAPICDNQLCIPNPTQSGPCVTNDDCVAPYECNTAGQCVPPGPEGAACGPLTATPCPGGEMCIAGHCQPIPTDQPCTNNDDCPTGWLCVNGFCLQNVPPGGTPCVQDPDCPSGQICVSGLCINSSQCQNPPPANRLNGTWQFDSLLHLRDALPGWLSGILTATETLRDIIQGNLNIPGLPGFIENFIEDIIQGLINAYVPPWAQQLIIAMGNISDIVDDMRVYSTVNLVSQGGYEYVGSQTWDIIEFEYQGQYISESPSNIPQIGYIPQQMFTSREVCEFFYIDRFDVDNVVGGLIRWGIEAMLTAVTCSVPGWPCYYSLEDALDDLIDCDDIAYAIDDMVYNTFGFDVYDAVYNVCDNMKQPAITAIINALDNIEVSLSLMSMRGEADIQDDWNMINGHWYGTLVGGNYDGDFTATK